MADDHCLEMGNSNYTSHWNLAGQKPYQRYSAAGFVDHIVEKVHGIDAPDGDVLDISSVGEFDRLLGLCPVRPPLPFLFPPICFFPCKRAARFCLLLSSTICISVI